MDISEMRFEERVAVVIGEGSTREICRSIALKLDTKGRDIVVINNVSKPLKEVDFRR